MAAVAGYPSVVLLAGGVSKGVDLGALTTVRDHLRAVVAIGDTPDEVETAFAGTVPTVRAGSMRAAVRTAADLARPGDVVLLSPACASFDWYDVQPNDFSRSTIWPPQPGVGHGPTTARSLRTRAAISSPVMPWATNSAASSGVITRPPIFFQIW